MTGTIAGFTSTGIDDNATSTKVTVSDTGTTVVGFIKSDSIAPAPGGIAAPGVSLNWYKIGSLALHGAKAGVLTVLGTKDYSGVGAISAESKLILRGGTVNTTLAGHYSANSQGSATPQFAWKNTASGVFDIYASNAQFGNLNSYYKGEGSWNASYSDTGSTSLPTGSTAFVSKYGISIDGAANFMFDSDGLKFNGDTAAANALDDYEEGTWTPTFYSSGVGGHTLNYANYVKIGRLVTINMYVYNFTSITGGGVSFGITNLPFTQNVQALGPVTATHTDFHNYYGHSVARLYNGVAYIEQSRDAAAGHWLPYSAFNGNSHVEMSITYETAQ
jgi:hypothetical protein